jgi:putative flippase GtrA
MGSVYKVHPFFSMTPSVWLRQGSLRRVINQFLCFAGIGAVGTVAHYSILIILVQIAQVNPLPASMVGFVTGALINYSLNYHITFQSEKYHLEAVSKFFIVALVGLILNSFIMILAIRIFALYYLLAQMFATGVVLVWNFAGSCVWTFGEARR